MKKSDHLKLLVSLLSHVNTQDRKAFVSFDIIINHKENSNLQKILSIKRLYGIFSFKGTERKITMLRCATTHNFQCLL
jgi:hypothetical protein